MNERKGYKPVKMTTHVIDKELIFLKKAKDQLKKITDDDLLFNNLLTIC